MARAQLPSCGGFRYHCAARSRGRGTVSDFMKRTTFASAQDVEQAPEDRARHSIPAARAATAGLR
jgi:hypothetical protein